MKSAAVSLFCGVFLLFLPCRLHGQASAESPQIQELRNEVAALRAELAGLKSELRQMQAPSPAGTPSTASDQPVAVPQGDDALGVLQAQVAELAQTKVEANSRQPVKIFGTIISSTQLNTGEANWIDIPNLVLARTPGQPTGSFSSNLRQSRIGVIVSGPSVGRFRTQGFAAMDFFGGIASFQTAQVLALPRLLYGYVRMDDGKTAFEAGQDQMIFAPNNPTSLAAMSFPDFYRSGNLYLRAPQLRVERRLYDGESGHLDLAAGLLAPIGGDFTSTDYVFVPPALGGERSKQPAVQGRLAWRARRADSGKSWELGLSGHYNRERSFSASIPSWGAAFDYDANMGRFGLGGEWYAGRDLGKFGGSLGQFGKSWGGYGELRYRATQKLEFNAGYGTDRLYDRAAFPAALTYNSSVFANTIYRFVPEFAASFEYKWLGTAPAAAPLRKNNNLNLVFAYSF